MKSVSEPFELNSEDLGQSVKEEPFVGVNEFLAVAAVVLVVPREVIDPEVVIEGLLDTVGSLAFLG